jgi:NhaP-type Na+/H+ or K+/H+ antiporter
VILEGESLLNDASALLIYRLAVGAVAAGGFNAAEAAPTFVIVTVGSVVSGWLLAWPVSFVTGRVSDAPSSAILQFVFTFGVWLAAERLGLSGVVTVVVFGLTLARRTAVPLSARIRVPSFAIWETATMVLNVLAFTLIGLQIRPLIEAVNPAERLRLIAAALAVLAVTIGVRLAWTFTYDGLLRLRPRRPHRDTAGSAVAQPSTGAALIVGWAGMRGIVTLATALALPIDFPYRDFIQLSAFTVVLGTLLIQGLTLRPLLSLVRLPKEDTVEAEVRTARRSALEAALAELEGNDTPAAQRLRVEYQDALDEVASGRNPRDTADNALRRRAVAVSRQALDGLRNSGVIGDVAYRQVEEELDLMELSAQPALAEE